jgi:hypothetical protein
MTSRYLVGYKRPPKHSRFRKGQSGNPKGRSRGRRNLKTVLAEQLGRTLKANLDGRPREITQVEAIVLSMVTSAIKGDARARDAVLRMMQVLGLLDQQEHEARPVSADEQQLLDVYSERIKRRVKAPADSEPLSLGRDAQSNKENAKGVRRA